MKIWNTPAWRAGDWRGWLSDHGSLTRRLQSICPRLRVRRLSQRIGTPYPDESASLGLRRGQRALLRDVLLICGDTPLVYAHSVIPLPGLDGPWVGLSRLGNRPLGEALFADLGCAVSRWNTGNSTPAIPSTGPPSPTSKRCRCASGCAARNSPWTGIPCW
jgi:hypothetical protein